MPRGNTGEDEKGMAGKVPYGNGGKPTAAIPMGIRKGVDKSRDLEFAIIGSERNGIIAKEVHDTNLRIVSNHRCQ